MIWEYLFFFLNFSLIFDKLTNGSLSPVYNSEKSLAENLTENGLSPIGDFFGGVTRLHIAIQVQIMLFAIIFKAAFFKKQSKRF